MTMSEITKQIDAPLVVEEIQTIEIEVLPCEAQVPLAPEIISGRHAATGNEETDSNFRPFTEIADQIGASTAPAFPERVIQPIWPWAVLALALVSTAVWICLLGYGLVKIIELAI
jgi:hypothetical protein